MPTVRGINHAISGNPPEYTRLPKPISVEELAEFLRKMRELIAEMKLIVAETNRKGV